MIIAFIAIAIVVPLMIAEIIAVTTPAESRDQPSNSYVVALHAERVDNDTIRITHLGGEGKPLLDKDIPFLIYLNGMDATNICSPEINCPGLTIYPDTGLGCASGSSVTYSGDAVAANHSVRVLVYGNYDDGASQNMLDVTLN